MIDPEGAEAVAAVLRAEPAVLAHVVTRPSAAKALGADDLLVPAAARLAR